MRFELLAEFLDDFGVMLQVGTAGQLDFGNGKKRHTLGKQ